jgi:hypothetical protein
MAHLAGKSGSVYVATTLIDNCEDAWVNGTNGTASLETTIIKVGSGSSKVVMGASITNGDIVMYEAIAAGATNYSSFTHALCWARSSSTTSAADLRLVIDKDSGAPASPETLLDFPILTANTWKYCHLTNVTDYEISKSTAGLTVGLEMNANAAQLTVYLDDIRAAKNIAGINTWTLDYTSDALETTDFADAGVKSYVIGGSGWTGTFAGYKDGVPLSIGEQYGIELAESATTTQMWLGTIFITGVNPTVGHDGVVSYSYTFQGTGDLTVAST